MAGILCIGYDVESNQTKVTRHFLETMVELHESLEAPCTLFVKGTSLKQNIKELKRLVGNPWIDLQQHTYSHLIFKRINQVIDGELKPVGNDEPAEKIRNEIQRTSQLFRKKLAVDIIGLTTPYAFFNGLRDRPDALQVLWDEGIRFVRSFGRNEQGYNPVSLDVQPFFYGEQGFPGILECPVQGWQDCIWRDRFGWDASWEDQVAGELDYISEHDLYLGLAQHDWSSVQEDWNMDRTKAIIKNAKDRGVTIMSYNDFYLKMKAKYAI